MSLFKVRVDIYTAGPARELKPVRHKVWLLVEATHLDAVEHPAKEEAIQQYAGQRIVAVEWRETSSNVRMPFNLTRWAEGQAK